MENTEKEEPRPASGGRWAKKEGSDELELVEAPTAPEPPVEKPPEAPPVEPPPASPEPKPEPPPEEEEKDKG